MSHFMTSECGLSVTQLQCLFVISGQVWHAVIWCLYRYLMVGLITCHMYLEFYSKHVCTRNIFCKLHYKT